MPSPNLPVNIDTTYADSGTDASVKTHQQHHDALHGVVNAFDTGIGTATTGQVLKWNGSVYAPAADAVGSGASPIPNVKDYGAVGNGTTDDTTAIEAAFAVNGSIYFPAGNYRYTGNGLYRQLGISIQGAGVGVTQITLDADKSLVVGSGEMWNLTIRDIVKQGLVVDNTTA